MKDSIAHRFQRSWWLVSKDFVSWYSVASSRPTTCGPLPAQFRTLAPQEHFLTLSSVSGQASVVYTYLGWSTPSYSELLLHRVPAAECPCDCDPLLLRQGLQFRRRPSAAPLRQGSVMALLLRVLLAHALSPCAASLLTFQYQS